MPDTFVRFEQLLRPPLDEPREEIVETPEAPRAQPCEELDDTLSRVRRFRAALADAFDVALEQLLQDLATEIVARELALAPVEMAGIVQKALARLDDEAVVRVRVHPDEAPALEGLDLPVVSDPLLRRGDAMLDVRSGTIDVSLGARLEAVLARC